MTCWRKARLLIYNLRRKLLPGQPLTCLLLQKPLLLTRQCLLRAKPEITVPKPEPIAQPTAEMKAVSTATAPPTQTPEVKLNEKFKTDKPTLNESLKKPEAPI